MRQVYISLYKKSGVEKIAKILQDNEWEIISAFSTYTYLTEKDISSLNLNTEVHPSFAVISDIASAKRKYGLKNLQLVIADIPEELPDELYNFTLVTACIRKKIPVLFPDDFSKYYEILKIYGEFNENIKNELIYRASNLISYIISANIYKEKPYLNEISNTIILPLKKIKEIKGENPHQKAWLFSIPLKDEFEIIKGNPQTNHLLDIKKAKEILSETDLPFFMSLNHTNISEFIWGNEIIKSDSYSGHTFVFNLKINMDIAIKITKTRPEIIIARDFDKDALSYLDKNNISIIVKFPQIIKTPKEVDIFFISPYFIIQNKDITEIRFKNPSMKKLSPDLNEKIKVSSIIIKNLKTFSSAVIYGKKITGISQGEDSTTKAVMKALYESSLKLKQLKITESEEKLTIVTDGFINSELADRIISYPVDAVICCSVTEENIIHKLQEKNIILIMTEKRYYKHN